MPVGISSKSEVIRHFLGLQCDRSSTRRMRLINQQLLVLCDSGQFVRR
jgi:hypothetical protein